MARWLRGTNNNHRLPTCSKQLLTSAASFVLPTLLERFIVSREYNKVEVRKTMHGTSSKLREFQYSFPLLVDSKLEEITMKLTNVMAASRGTFRVETRGVSRPKGKQRLLASPGLDELELEKKAFALPWRCSALW